MNHCVAFISFRLTAFTLAILFLNPGNLNAQPDVYVDISRIVYIDTLDEIAQFAITENESKKDAGDLEFNSKLPFRRTAPPNVIGKTVFVRFHVLNSSDTVKGAYFFPGVYFNHIALYRQENSSLIPLKDEFPAVRDSIGYRYLTVEGGDSITIVASLRFVKTYINQLRPRLINETYIGAFNTRLRIQHSNLDMTTYIFCGLLLMMILFSIGNYLLGGNTDFLFYSGYAFFIGAMLFVKSYYYQSASAISYFMESYLDFMLQCAGIIFYMIFLQRFLSTRRNHPFLYWLYYLGVIALGLTMVSFSLLHFAATDYIWQFRIETYIKYFLLLLIIVFIVYGFRHWHDKVLRYLLWGNMGLFVFALASQAMISFKIKFDGVPAILNASLFYYELGLLIELIMFLMGLSYKNRIRIIAQTEERERLKADNQRKEYEKELAVYRAQQEERNRISADMHDELGSGMTAIRLMSEIARNKMKEQTPPELTRISASADDLLNKMNAIIWSMNSGNDTLDNLVSYIRTFCVEFCESTGIDCRFDAPENIPAWEISGDKRRNIFLCIKETLNNIAKHSGASQLRVYIDLNGELKIQITDNGRGIDVQNLRQFGNGLKNISRRMNSIGGEFQIRNENGTITTLRLPVSPHDA